MLLTNLQTNLLMQDRKKGKAEGEMTATTAMKTKRNTMVSKETKERRRKTFA